MTSRSPVQCLSHGQKKRVVIAGALVLQAKYLLLDEPTAGLDPSGRQQMIPLIQRIVARGNHVIISSHDIALTFGSYHDVDSPEMVFRMVAIFGFKEGAKRTDPAILELVMNVEVETPEEYAAISNSPR